jgi:hypothetical protein
MARRIEIHCRLTAVEAAAESEMWAYERAVAWATEAARRRAAALYLRRLAIQRGARPFVPRYVLAPDVGVFEGKIYRIIDIAF